MKLYLSKKGFGSFLVELDLARYWSTFRIEFNRFFSWPWEER